MRRIDLIYEDASILVVRKPAGLESQRGKSLQQDMESLLRGYLSEKSGQANPYLAVIHRLDRPVAGVMVYAKTKQAAASLSGQLQKGQFHKLYEAVVVGKPEAAEATLKNWLVSDKRTGMTRLAKQGEPQAQAAVLQYQQVDAGAQRAKDLFAPYRSLADRCGLDTTALQVRLETGRHHQIRVQLSGIGCPILGDTRYGQAQGGEQRAASEKQMIRLPGYAIGLCAVSLSFRHPSTGKYLTFHWNHDTNI